MTDQLFARRYFGLNRSCFLKLVCINCDGGDTFPSRFSPVVMHVHHSDWNCICSFGTVFSQDRITVQIGSIHHNEKKYQAAGFRFELTSAVGAVMLDRRHGLDNSTDRWKERIRINSGCFKRSENTSLPNRDLRESPSDLVRVHEG